MESKIDLRQVRVRSWGQVLESNLAKNPSLPLLDSMSVRHTLRAVQDRLLCAYAVASCAWGSPTVSVLEWLGREALTDALSVEEGEFLLHGRGDKNLFRYQVQGTWALAWALGIIPELSLDPCNDDFVKLLPDPKTKNSVRDFRESCRLRSDIEIVEACDFHYCVHWALVDAALAHRKVTTKISIADVSERRRALEWLVGDEDWYEISLDT